MGNKHLNLKLWTLAALLLSAFVFSCCDKLETGPEISGTHSYICYNSVGKCVLDVSFNLGNIGESKEIHYDKKYDVISISSTSFTWKQKGNKINLKGTRAVAYRDGDHSENKNWEGTFEYVDGYWVPGTGFSSDYKEYLFSQIALKNDEQNVKECVSVTQSFNKENCMWTFKISNMLGKYYKDTAYRFGCYYYNSDGGHTATYYAEENNETTYLLMQEIAIAMYLSSIKNLEKIGSANWTKEEKRNYEGYLSIVNKYRARVGKEKFGYVFLELNGKKYTLLEY